MDLGLAIKQYRKLNNLTQQELAEKANISRSYLADVEKNRYNPSLDTLNKIAEALNIPLSVLLGEDNKAKSFSDNLNKLDNEEAKLSYINTIMDFAEPEEAVKFILQQPMFMAYGGYDLKSMSDEEILEVAQDMLFAMKLSLEKRKKKNK